jgi:D-glycero-D-manno-heptose 1,7-bisphosphate phosphatase
LSDAAVFMDRDGTVIVDAGYPSRAEQVELLPDTAAALARLKAGIGRGLVTEADAQRVHARFVAVLADAGVDLDGAYYCPHAPEDACTCRKPSPELILRAARELDLDPGRSFMVGDRDSDLESGRRAGCRTILLGRPTDGGPVADHVAGSWADVCEYVERVAKPAAA